MALMKFFRKEKPLEPMKSSPGKLKAYLQCPMKYKYLYVEQRPVEKKASPHLAFDGILKRSLEDYQKKLVFRDGDITPDTLKDKIEALWETDPIEADDSKEFHEAALTAAEIMTRWFAHRETHALTYRGKPAVGIFVPLYVQPVTVWTRLDRVERGADGDIRLVMFKSGGRQPEASYLMRDLSIRINAAATREQFGSGFSGVDVVFLRTGDVFAFTSEQLKLDTLPGEILDIVRKIQAGEFPPNPGPLCSACEYLEGCEGWREPPWTKSRETREVYSRRLRLSYSKMSLFERCPLAYKKLYIDGIPPKPRSFFSFGSCIHAVMEEYYDARRKEPRTLELFWKLLDEKWEEFNLGYQSEQEEANYRRKARDMLEQYYHRFVAGGKFKPAAFIEEYFEMPVGPDSVMTGFIDRIDEISRKKYIVLDYKTEPTDRTQDAVDSDLQLTLYYWAARDFLGLNVEKLGLFMMAHDKLITTTRKPMDIPLIQNRIIEVTKAIRAETKFEPSINKYCLGCDHLRGCPLEKEIRARNDLRTMEYSEEEMISG